MDKVLVKSKKDFDLTVIDTKSFVIPVGTSYMTKENAKKYKEFVTVINSTASNTTQPKTPVLDETAVEEEVEESEIKEEKAEKKSNKTSFDFI